MGPFILRRFIHLIPTFLGAMFLAFMISQLTPGDYFTTREMDPNVQPETLERLRARFHLDQSIPVQFVYWIGNIARGDLGESMSSNQPVWNVISNRIGNSMILVVFSTILLYAMAIPLGIFSAVRQYSFGDQVISFFSYVALAIPNFFLALLFILLIFIVRTWTRELFGYNQLLLPVAQMTSSGHLEMTRFQQILDIFWHMLMPAFVIATAGIAGFTRVLRGQMLEFMGSDFIRTARAKGLGERAVTYKHALRPALIPFVAGIGGLLPSLVGGAGLVEIVVSWPGITPTFLNAINQRDVFVYLGLLVISTLLLIIGNLLSDLLLAVVDPRIRYS